MSLESKHIVLINDQDIALGIMDKVEGHNSDTPLHRGFSVFLFNNENKVLLQQRALNKKTWPGFWSNSYCGHPQIDETYEQAVHRHAEFELNAKLATVRYEFNYQYKAMYNNIYENEICYVYTAVLDGDIITNKEEIEAVKWMDWQEFIEFQSLNSSVFTPWCVSSSTKISEGSGAR